ncbi:hypothetical protein [Parasitella parasitica]|uniref:DBF4-type domain-containing protein n=1 Tax=Parasitella parasitica TaxID=35722 RepID=A0A0B7MYI5_9FUNG|nr:hypothetical protein [Parasitella parasitica]
MSFPLNNNTNTVRQPQNIWIKPDAHLGRPSHNSREQELHQKLQQTTLAPGTKNVHHDEFPKLPAAEIAARKKKFASFKFFLDNLDPLVSKRIERGIKLMGATHEAFFSKDCTHLITTKSIPYHENLLAPTINSTASSPTTKPTTSTKKYDAIIESAIQFNTVLWSADVMRKTVEFLMNVSSRKEVQEKRALGKVLQEEKLFGPSTGTNSEAQSKRPHFVPFTGHFLIVEDATQAHRPPVCKQWTKEVFTKKPAEYPWPYFKQTPKLRSPFGKRAPPPPKQPTADTCATTCNPAGGNATASAKKTDPAKNNLQEDKENIPAHKQAASGIAAAKPLATPSSLSSQKSQQPAATQKQPESQNFSLRASGFQPSCTNNIQSASTRSVSILQGGNRRLTPGDSVNRLDKRMIENVGLNEQEKLNKQKAQQEHQARQEQELKKKRDSRFCENCNMAFENLEEHSKQQTHQTFIRDQNNFKELDALLAKIHRRYKQPLPDHMKGLIDTSIDGKNVEFVSDLKRARPTASFVDASSPSSRKLSTADMIKKKSIAASQPRIATNESNINELEG